MNFNSSSILYNSNGNGGNGTVSTRPLGGDGGGIYVNAGILNLNNTTVKFNQAGTEGLGYSGRNSGSGRYGGGLYLGYSSVFTLTNSSLKMSK